MKRRYRYFSRRPFQILMFCSSETLRESRETQRLLGILVFWVSLFSSAAILCYILKPIEIQRQSNDIVAGADDLTSGWEATLHNLLPELENTSLVQVLEAAAMEDKTVILATLNEAWGRPDSIVDLFLQSFRIGIGTRKLMNHLVIIALDQGAYARCLYVHIHCFTLKTEGVDFSGEKDFMTEDYLKMMWRRIDFLRSVLEIGYSFIFTDADVMWFRDPFLHFHPNADIQIACDHFSGNATDLHNIPNGGFIYARSNTRAIKFYEFWYRSREAYPGYHDQDVLNFIKYDPFVAEIGLQIRFLDTAIFGGFCEPSKDLRSVCTMHANCCIGLDSKIHDLSILLEDWRTFMSSPLSHKMLCSWNVPRNCSLH